MPKNRLTLGNANLSKSLRETMNIKPATPTKQSPVQLELGMLTNEQQKVACFCNLDLYDIGLNRAYARFLNRKVSVMVQ